jgi:hypothetical protein
MFLARALLTLPSLLSRNVAAIMLTLQVDNSINRLDIFGLHELF